MVSPHCTNLLLAWGGSRGAEWPRSFLASCDCYVTELELGPVAPSLPAVPSSKNGPAASHPGSIPGKVRTGVVTSRLAREVVPGQVELIKAAPVPGEHPACKDGRGLGFPRSWFSPLTTDKPRPPWAARPPKTLSASELGGGAQPWSQADPGSNPSSAPRASSVTPASHHPL